MHITEQIRLHQENVDNMQHVVDTMLSVQGALILKRTALQVPPPATVELEIAVHKLDSMSKGYTWGNTQRAIIKASLQMKTSQEALKSIRSKTP